MKKLKMKNVIFDEYTEVESSNIKAVGIFGIDLIIWFNNESVYLYKRLATEYSNLINAESIGKYFHKNIRPCKNYYRKCSLNTCFKNHFKNNFCKEHKK